MDLSIVIPAYEESKKIAKDVQAAATFLHDNNFSGQIIVVDDGSRDNTAKAAGKVDIPQNIELKIIRYEQHRGKGYAVRKGIMQTAGQYVMFADSGGCVPYKDTLRGLDLIKSGAYNIAHGSRRIRDCHIEKAQSLYRRICSMIFHWFVINIMKIPAELTDTQCGFKIYSGDVARELYGKCITDGFTFDIEIIIRATQAGYRIGEFPVDWTCDPDTRLSPTRSLRRVLCELWAIKKITSH